MIRKQTQFAVTLMSREIDIEVRALEDPDEDSGPLIMRVPGDNMKVECRSSLG